MFWTDKKEYYERREINKREVSDYIDSFYGYKLTKKDKLEILEKFGKDELDTIEYFLGIPFHKVVDNWTYYPYRFEGISCIFTSIPGYIGQKLAVAEWVRTRRAIKELRRSRDE